MKNQQQTNKKVLLACIQMSMNWFGMLIDIIELYIFILVSVAFTLIQSHSDARKQKILLQFAQHFQSIWMEFGILLLTNLIFFYLFSVSIQGRIPFLCDFTRKTINVGLSLDVFLSFSFELCSMIKTTALYILIPVWMTLAFIQGHSCMRNQKLLGPYLILSIP